MNFKELYAGFTGVFKEICPSYRDFGAGLAYVCIVYVIAGASLLFGYGLWLVVN